MLDSISYPSHDSKGRPYPEGFFDPTMLNGKPFDSTAEEYGPVYPRLPGMAKFRKLDTADNDCPEFRREYCAALKKEFRKLYAIKPSIFVDADLTYNMHAAVKRGISANINAGLAQDRANKLKHQQAEYAAAMEAKALPQSVVAVTLPPLKLSDLI